MDPEDKLNTETGKESEPVTVTSTVNDSPTDFYKSKAEEAEAKVAALAKELEQARFTLSQKRIEDKGKDTETVVVDPDEIANKVRAQIKEEEAKSFRENLPNIIQDKEELAQLEYYLDNRIVPSGNVEQDFAEAYALVHGKKLEETNKELIRTLQTRAKQPDLVTNSVDGNDGPVLSEADKRFIALADSKLKRK